MRVCVCERERKRETETERDRESACVCMQPSIGHYSDTGKRNKRKKSASPTPKATHRCRVYGYANGAGKALPG